MTENDSLLVMTKPEQKVQIDFSGNLHYKHVTVKPYFLIGISRYSKWPVIRICKSMEAGEVIKFQGFVSL